MEKKHLMVSLSFLLLVATSSSSLSQLHAYKYNIVNNVPNTPGGRLFDRQIGRYFTMNVLSTANQFIWKVFNQTEPFLRRNLPLVTLYISDFDGYAYKNGPDVNVSGPALDKFYYPRSMSRFYFTSLMYHELTHVFQWHGNFTAPGGLTEGIADYVMVKANVYEKEKYTKPGAGKRWDEGYGVTERFLEYCDGLRLGFTAELNKKMRYSYSDGYFVDLLGKSVDQLWREYKAKYGNRVDSLEEDRNVSTAGTMFPGVEY